MSGNPAPYRLRYRFECGLGACLWALDDATRDRFGDVVDAADLPLPENTWRRVIYLTAWYDTGLDWSYPPDPSPWDAEEHARFDTEARRMLHTLREQLGPAFEVEDGLDPPPV